MPRYFVTPHSRPGTGVPRPRTTLPGPARYSSPVPMPPGRLLNRIATANRNQFLPSTGTPQFPGYTSGANIDQIRDIIKDQERCTGLSFTAPIGAGTLQAIQLPGDARMFLGFIFTNSVNVGDTFTMTINNNKIIDTASIRLHSIENSQSIKTKYYPYTQPLSGQDKIQFTLNTIAGMTGVIQLHYI